MALSDLRSYDFKTAAQWGAGLRYNLALDQSGLQAPSRYALTRVADSGPDDATPAVAVERCGDVYWLRGTTLELVRATGESTIVLGRLARDGAWSAAGLVVGRRYVWALLSPVDDGERALRLRAYERNGLRASLELSVARPVRAMCSDGGDGVWLVLAGHPELRHVEASGATADLPIRADGTPVHATAAAQLDDGVVVLEVDPRHDDHTPIAWQLWAASREVHARRPLFAMPRTLRACGGPASPFRPRLVAADSRRRIHLLQPPTRTEEGPLWTLETDATSDTSSAHRYDVSSEMPRTIPTSWQPLVGFVAADRLVVSGALGVATLDATESVVPTTPDAIPAYLTPAMWSPEGRDSGWMRVDLDVELAEGSAVEVAVAATSNPTVVEDVAALFASDLPATLRCARIEARLPWLDEETIVYRGEDRAAGAPLRFPLHQIDERYVWLRIRLHAATGAPPRLRRLRVLYPNRSYVRYVPAVFLEDPVGADVLRRLLAVFESVFGDLEAELDALPARIDPETAPREWLGALVQWLGLPAPTELDPKAQRELLKRAPEMLAGIGTEAALSALLEIVVGLDGSFVVHDRGASPSPWVLPSGRQAAFDSRLGCDTMVFAAPRAGFRLGTTTLGTPLGEMPADRTQAFARCCGAIEIRISCPVDRRRIVDSLLRRYLPYFVPAHCRWHIRYVAPDALHDARVVGTATVDVATPTALGAGSRVGRMRLADPSHAELVVGRSWIGDAGNLS